jgi:hypothetical protein
MKTNFKKIENLKRTKMWKRTNWQGLKNACLSPKNLADLYGASVSVPKGNENARARKEATALAKMRKGHQCAVERT